MRMLASASRCTRRVRGIRFKHYHVDLRGVYFTLLTLSADVRLAPSGPRFHKNSNAVFFSSPEL